MVGASYRPRPCAPRFGALWSKLQADAAAMAADDIPRLENDLGKPTSPAKEADVSRKADASLSSDASSGNWLHNGSDEAQLRPHLANQAVGESSSSADESDVSREAAVASRVLKYNRNLYKKIMFSLHRSLRIK